MHRVSGVILIVAVAVGCQDRNPTAPGDDAPVRPTVSTSEITGITANTAMAGGAVTQDGGAPITARGVVWSTLRQPTVFDAKTEEGTGTGAFVSEIGGLSPETTYYVRAYATNRSGTAYGDAVSFTTGEGDFAIRVLGTMGDSYALGNDINVHCHVAGSYWLGTGYRAYSWNPGAGFQDIGPDGAQVATGYRLNDEGTVAGIAVVAIEGNLRDRAFTWNAATGEQLYHPPAATGLPNSWGSAVNSHGAVVGFSHRWEGNEIVRSEATLWWPDGTAARLPNGGCSRSAATAINDAGVIAGRVHGEPAVWLSPDQEPVLLASAGYAGMASTWAINNRGDIVGTAGPRAVLWRDGQPTFLKALPGHQAADARDLTEPDVDGVIRVVGTSSQRLHASSDERRPVIWTVNGSDVQIAELYPPGGHAGAIPKAVKIVQGEVIVVGTSFVDEAAFAVLWSTSRDVCKP